MRWTFLLPTLVIEALVTPADRTRLKLSLLSLAIAKANH